MAKKKLVKKHVSVSAQTPKKMGFVEIPVEENSHYERSDIKMLLEF